MARTPEEKKIAQAAAHKRWRLGPRGQAYYEKRRKNGISEGQSARQEIQEAWQADREEAEVK